MPALRRLGAIICATIALTRFQADACARFIYETGSSTYIVGRSMDRAEDPGTDLWSFPRVMARDGGLGDGWIAWTSKYGSVIASFHNIATVEGMNDAGLVANTLYLLSRRVRLRRREGLGQAADFGGAQTQYVLDNYGSVVEAVDALAKEPFAIVAPELPGGERAGGHLPLCRCAAKGTCGEYVTVGTSPPWNQATPVFCAIGRHRKPHRLRLVPAAPGRDLDPDHRRHRTQAMRKSCF